MSEQQSAHVGARIRLKRTWRGMTAIELSRGAGISKGYLSELENGRQDNPSGRVLKRIAAALGVTVDWLLDDEVHA